MMSSEVSNPHDAFFKQYLGHAEAAANFLRHHLPPTMGQLLDLSQLRLEKDSLLRYIARSGVGVKKEVVAQKLLAVLPKEGGVLMQTMAEAWIEEGRQEGRQEGKIEARVDLILLLLRRRFQPTEEMLQSLAQQLAEIHNEEILGQLLDAALDVLVLPDFIVKLRTVLPNTTTHN